VSGGSGPRVLGTETEFGIAVRGQPDFNAVLASSLVINSYAGAASRIQWSYEEETPGRDARGFGYEPAPTGDFDSGLVNVVLSNGARFYVDHAHPEYSTPECVDAREAALHDKAGEVVLERAAAGASETMPPELRVLIHKNNSDGKGNSYGAHENYLVPRSVPFGDIVRHMIPFLVTRQIFTGSGKVGSENDRPPVDFQVTQRADFFEEEVGLETTLKRPIVNTRDEPHADPSKYRRLHVIVGDATLNEVQTFLKLGSASLVLAAIEAEALHEPLTLDDPVAAIWQVSHDPTLTSPIRLGDGSTARPLDLQWLFLERVSKHVEIVGATDVERDVLATWEGILTDLERDPSSTRDRLDWTAKLWLLEEYRDRENLAWNSPKIRLLDLQYHDVDRARGLYHRLVGAGRVKRLFDDAEVEAAVATPPPGTRAYFRGACVSKYGSAIVAANWDSLLFDTGDESLKRVPMMEPLRGRKDLVGGIIDRADTPEELIGALGGDHDG
jgi:Pup amidohydrolase